VRHDRRENTTMLLVYTPKIPKRSAKLSPPAEKNYF
ncbi:MAG: hypothetical protein RLZZ339_2863, partial [Cyanobacteriota bacterium]